MHISTHYFIYHVSTYNHQFQTKRMARATGETQYLISYTNYDVFIYHVFCITHHILVLLIITSQVVLMSRFLSPSTSPNISRYIYIYNNGGIVYRQMHTSKERNL